MLLSRSHDPLEYHSEHYAMTNKILCLSAILIFCNIVSSSGCSPPIICEGEISNLTIDPNGGKCQKRCDCNNQNYEGKCLDGICVAIIRKSCLQIGETQECTLPFAQQGCKKGIQRCRGVGLKVNNWGDCRCVGTSSEVVQESPVSERPLETKPERELKDAIQDASEPPEKQTDLPPLSENSENCRPGQHKCDEKCVSTQNNLKHCGKCNHPCKSGMRCIEGQCSPASSPLALGFGGPGIDSGDAITTDSQNQVYIAGTFRGVANFGSIRLTANGGGSDIFIAVLDSLGKLKWARSYGGSQGELVTGIQVDDSGNIYITGTFSSKIQFAQDVLKTSSPTDKDIFVAKLDKVGSPIWGRRLGGTGEDASLALLLGGKDELYITGHFQKAISTEKRTITSQGKSDIFIAQLSTSNRLDWLLSYGGPEEDRGHAIANDRRGNLFIAGSIRGTALFGSRKLVVPQGEHAAFILKLNNKQTLLWAIKMEGRGSSTINGLTSDTRGNVLATGAFSLDLKFDTTLQVKSHGKSDVFVAKVDGLGKPIWLRAFGGPEQDVGIKVAVNIKGQVYVIGQFEGQRTFGGPKLKAWKGKDIFVVKYGDKGALEWSKSFGGNGDDNSTAITYSDAGFVYVTGHYGDRFEPLLPSRKASMTDIFVLRLNP